MSLYLPRSEQIAAMLKGGQTVQGIANEILSWRNLKSARIDGSAVSEEWGIKRKEDGTVDTQKSINHPRTLGCLYQLAEELHDAGIKLIWTVPRFMWCPDPGQVAMIETPEEIEVCIEQHRNAGCRFEHIDALHLNEPWQKKDGFAGPQQATDFLTDYGTVIDFGEQAYISVDYRYPEWAEDFIGEHDYHIYFRPYDPMVCVRNLMEAQQEHRTVLKVEGNVVTHEGYKRPIITELGYWPTPRGESVSAEQVWTPEGVEITKGLVEIAERITGELCVICAGPWKFLDYKPARPFIEWLKEK